MGEVFQLQHYCADIEDPNITEETKVNKSEYDFTEVRKANEERMRKQREQRVREAQRLADSLKKKPKK